MIESVNKVLSLPCNQIISTGENLILLLEVYSTLYNNGAPCRTCSNSLRNYYLQIQKNGIAMANKFKQVQNRTCIPNWKGRIHITATGKHWIAAMLTDDEAVYLLTNGYLTEKYFDKLPEGLNNQNVDPTTLPEGYLEVIKNDIKEGVKTSEQNTELPIEQRNCIEEFKKDMQNGISKTKIREKCKSISMIGTERASQQLVNKLIKIAENEITQ